MHVTYFEPDTHARNQLKILPENYHISFEDMRTGILICYNQSRLRNLQS